MKNNNKKYFVRLINHCLSFLVLVLMMHLAKRPVMAFWSNQATSASIQFTTGDWTAPKINVSFHQSNPDKSYSVVDIIDDSCVIKQSSTTTEVTLSDTGISCKLNLAKQQEPQFLSFWYQQSLDNNLPLINQPSFKLDLVMNGQQKTVFVPGMSLDQASFGWHQVWLSLDDLADLFGGWDSFGQDLVQLQFRSLPLMLNHQTLPKPTVKLKQLTSQTLVVKPSDKLVLEADEPVNWQVKLLTDDKEQVVNLEGQKTELSFDQVASGVKTASLQIQATDVAGNQSQVVSLNTYFYQLSDVSLDTWQVKSEANGRLSFQFVMPSLPLGQVRGLSLSTDTNDDDQSIKLAKTVPFVSDLANSLSQSLETVVLTTREPVSTSNYCLKVQLLDGRWKTLKCHNL